MAQVKVIIIEGSTEEVDQVLRGMYGSNVRPEVTRVELPASHISKKEPDPELVKPWAEERLGKELIFATKEGEPHRCITESWEVANKRGIYLKCAHGHKTYRDYSLKVMRLKEIGNG